jgi:glycosyltransferase involved in cell wall biosynthesis
MKRILYTAAHHGFRHDQVPLGGGAAVCRHLVAEWEKTKPFPVEVLDPGLLGEQAPHHKDLVRYSEMDYAHFCLRFEEALTRRILEHDPKETVVLANDVCEGPDFKRLSEAGFPIYTIYHVDVVDYFIAMYLHGALRPETATRWYAAVDGLWTRRLLPSIARLLLPKQQDSVLYSRGLIVPSQAMNEVMIRCYPSVDPEKIHVLPWGIWDEEASSAETVSEVQALRAQWKIPEGRPVLLLLSRISPEKRQDRLLKALALWEAEADYPAQGLCVVIAGEAAYMQGVRFEKRLRRLAAGLRKTQAVFAGFAAGARKAALFELADLYVFPSEHESYGLTLLEAMRAGLPAVACTSHGTRDLVRPEFGALVPPVPERELPRQLKAAIQKLLSDPVHLKAMGRAAQRFAKTQRFSEAAASLAGLLLTPR